MSRSFWRCRNPNCSVPHGEVLGSLGSAGDLTFGADVAAFSIHLDTRKAVVVCPSCGARREFRAGSIHAARGRAGAGRGIAVGYTGSDNQVVDDGPPGANSDVRPAARRR